VKPCQGRQASVVLAALIVALWVGTARAQSTFSDAEVLGPPRSSIRIESIRTAVSGFSQEGHGYQSQAGPVAGPGSEHLIVFEPAVEVVARQGERLTHTLFAPVDIVTSASANAIDRPPAPPDVISSASQVNEAAALEWRTSYKMNSSGEWSTLAGFHFEEPLRSWNVGLGTKQGFADDNTVVGVSGNVVFDWFDGYELHGKKRGRVARTTDNGNIAVTQLLTPTTIGQVGYSLTVQSGELGNTWNIVPLDDGRVGSEILPRLRTRQAVVGRLAQWLPWNGALKGYYRYYWDDWGIAAHTFDIELRQQLLSWISILAEYRWHTQTAADFFTTRAPAASQDLRTADSDLAEFRSQMLGIGARCDLGAVGAAGAELSLGYERYFRTNDLAVNVYTWATGFRF
jgi:hypothetical protein